VAASSDEVLAAVDAAGLGTAFARELVAAAIPMAQVTARVSAAMAAKAEATAREKQIHTMCNAAKVPELASGYVRGAMTVADVKAHLAVLTAKFDKVEI